MVFYWKIIRTSVDWAMCVHVPIDGMVNVLIEIRVCVWAFNLRYSTLDMCSIIIKNIVLSVRPGPRCTASLAIWNGHWAGMWNKNVFHLLLLFMWRVGYGTRAHVVIHHCLCTVIEIPYIHHVQRFEAKERRRAENGECEWVLCGWLDTWQWRLVLHTSSAYVI